MAGVDVIIVGSVVGVVSLYSSTKKRNQMKLEDEEIKKEREKEIISETEKPLVVGINHHKHHHPLSEVESIEDDIQFVCGGCGGGGAGRRYRCGVDGCGFEMHRACVGKPVMLVGGDFGAEELPETVETFAHRVDGHVLRRGYGKMERFDCGHCCNIGVGFRYNCDGCTCILHPICAKSPTQINSFMHPEHELILITRPYFADCSFCHKGRKTNLNNRVYACKSCKFYLHPTCSLWPHYIFHQLHPNPCHPLQLKLSSSSSSSSSSMSSVKCNACKEKCQGSLVYCCESCNESYHPLCLLRSTRSSFTKVDDKSDLIFKKEVAKSEFRVDFAWIDHLGIIG